MPGTPAPAYINPEDLNIDINAYETIRQIRQIAQPTGFFVANSWQKDGTSNLKGARLMQKGSTMNLFGITLYQMGTGLMQKGASFPEKGTRL